MTTTMTFPGNTAPTFLMHFFGRGLEDERHVVERYEARADGDIVPILADTPRVKGQRRSKRVTATLKAVKEMRPAPNESIICTTLNLKASGVQYRGALSTGLFCDRRQVGHPSLTGRLPVRDTARRRHSCVARPDRVLNRKRPQPRARESLAVSID